MIAAGLALLALALPGPAPCTGDPCWQPPAHLRWDPVLGAAPDVRVTAGMYELDGFDTTAGTIRRIHALGRRAVCYLDAGTWERWRPDASRFPARVRGRRNGWRGERWLDIRRRSVLQPIMEHRIAMCRRKGFDGIELDNVDGYANATGFALTSRDQLAYNRWLAARAHERGLTVALKNDLGQVRALLPSFDYAIVEQCFAFRECGRLEPFVAAGKAVFEVEYGLRRASFCRPARRLGFSSVRKRPRLGNWVRFCR